MGDIERLLYPTDLSEASSTAFYHAVRFAEALDAQLHVVHIDTDRHGVRVHSPDQVRSRLEHQHQGREVRVAYGTARGSSHVDAICRVAAEANIDLVMIGSLAVRGGRHSLQRSIATVLLQEAAYPVLAVRPEHREGAQRVVVPVDFSDASALALGHAQTIARAWGAELMVLHVAEHAYQHSVLFGGGTDDAIQSQIEARAMDRLRVFANRTLPPNSSARMHVRVGHPATEIERFVHTVEARLLVVTTHGGACDWRLPLGSVADRILQQQPCPVMLVRPEVPVLRRSSSRAFSGMMATV